MVVLWNESLSVCDQDWMEWEEWTRIWVQWSKDVGEGLVGIGMSLSRCPFGPRNGMGGREAGGGVAESGCEIVR